MHKLSNQIQISTTQKKHKHNRLYLKLIIATALISFILLTSCTLDPGLMNIYFTGEGGAEVTLQWDSNIEPFLAGYRIYYGTASGTYETSIDVGDTTLCTVKGLDFNTTYYFTATAYNIYGGESFYADEIIFLTPDEDGVSL